MQYLCKDCSNRFEIHQANSLRCPLCGSINVEKIQNEFLYGDLLNDYVIDEKIGEGSISAVYKARRSDSDKKFVIKILKRVLQNNKQLQDRFLQEAQILKQISHENVISLVETGKWNESIFIVLEYINGEDLHKILRREGSLPFKKVASILIQVANGLGKAHEKGIIHRDVKPHNILMDASKTVKITDFGLAKLRQTPSKIGGTKVRGYFCGTPAYASPEQIRGDEPTIQSDIYSLGITAYQLCTGKLPYETGTIESILYEQLVKPVNTVRAINPGIPKSLDNLILEMTDKNPGNRPHATSEVVDRINSIIEEFKTRKIINSREIVQKKRNPLLTLFGMLCLLSGIAFFFINLNQKPNLTSSKSTTTDNYYPIKKNKAVIINEIYIQNHETKIIDRNGLKIIAVNDKACYTIDCRNKLETGYLFKTKDLQDNSNYKFIFENHNSINKNFIGKMIISNTEDSYVLFNQNFCNFYQRKRKSCKYKLSLPGAYYGFNYTDRDNLDKFIIFGDRKCWIVSLTSDKTEINEIDLYFLKNIHSIHFNPINQSFLVTIFENNEFAIFLCAIKNDSLISSERICLDNTNIQNLTILSTNSENTSFVGTEAGKIKMFSIVPQSKFERCLKSETIINNKTYNKQILAAQFINDNENFILLAKDNNKQLTLEIYDSEQKKLIKTQKIEKSETHEPNFIFTQNDLKNIEFKIHLSEKSSSLTVSAKKKNGNNLETCILIINLK